MLALFCLLSLAAINSVSAQECRRRTGRRALSRQDLKHSLQLRTGHVGRVDDTPKWPLLDLFARGGSPTQSHRNLDNALESRAFVLPFVPSHGQFATWSEWPEKSHSDFRGEFYLYHNGGYLFRLRLFPATRLIFRDSDYEWSGAKEFCSEVMIRFEEVDGSYDVVATGATHLMTSEDGDFFFVIKDSQGQ